ncbi:YeeE/YedE family protein [Rhodobacterales bacterium HKCCE2091]|nr:YeeE/YedE family protein [Rhodobacterales bacterium HKCCE2091]
MLELLGEPIAVFIVGLTGGILLGLAARLGRFCTLGMIEDAHFGGDRGRMWMWVLAIGTAMVLNFAADAAGLVDLTAASLLANRFSVLGAVLGGLMFGYGMAQAGNCGYGMLARLGGGDLRALVIALVMGVTAYMTLSGLLAVARETLFPVIPALRPSGYAHGLASATGLPEQAFGIAAGLALIGLAVAFIGPEKRRGRLFWGAVVGLAISSGFIGTWYVAANGFEALPVQSHTFTAPLGDTIRYAMFSTAVDPGFALGSVLGVVAGGFLGSLIRDGFRWEACDDARELRRQMGGAALMGVGAVIAAGCSVGQGLSAFSLLGFNAPIVAASIWLGAFVGLRQLILGGRSAAEF